jgi:hypothetical protein
MADLVPESAIDYDEIFRRGGRNHGDEDFALFKCPSCGRIYLLEYEVDTAYLDPDDLSRCANVVECSFDCVRCGRRIPEGEPWIGREAHPRFAVTWAELEASRWSWVARRPVAGRPAARGGEDHGQDGGQDHHRTRSLSGIPSERGDELSLFFT